jgi:hypothetical protein
MDHIENQETVYRWIGETFPGTDPESPRKSIRALEEMVELCLASGARYRDIQLAGWDGWEKGARQDSGRGR